MAQEKQAPMHEHRIPVSYGYCQCGCGQKTNLSVQDHPRYGWVKGEPLKYVRGHNNIGRHPRLKGEPYRVEDCGYQTPCWLWNGFLSPSGYGQASRGGRPMRAHRLMYERKHGPIPEGLHIDHLCRVHACVNPDHLEPVTPAENARRGRGTKLNVEKVMEIKRRLSLGETLSHIAEDYEVGITAIHKIRTGRSWADV